jgi:hypothetical protein
MSALLGIIGAIPGKLKLWLSIAGAVIVAIAVAYFKGRASGHAASEAAELKRRQAAIKTARRIEGNVESLSDDELDRRLSRWVSDGER